ncbi:uncharacterized protein LOC130743406 isoform X2 [Lotus japonicus]|uniref:uncharacterized protein LOC130743406 isoform X2 n=1 Tax=Lotus japonicus TaxID=34305 RepID=UPI00258B5B23|nr:uncharacterized protein LOC130743406 isoform X2 [Lotus japonicus]
MKREGKTMKIPPWRDTTMAHIDTTTMNGGTTTTTTTTVIKRGDIVWAMLHFPHTWLPALVLSSSELAVTVSFFTTTTTIPHRTHFTESELLPFEHAFPSLVSPHINHAAGRDTFRASLHSALRFFGLSVVSGLQCRCQTGSELTGSGYQFDPSAVLAFVLDAAVSPWVESPRLVDAVRVVAQIHAFRGYSSIQQKRVCREKRKLGDNMKQHQCSSLGEKTRSVTQESVSLEPKEKCQIISKQGEKNMAIGAMKRLNSTVSVLEENSEHLFQNKLLIIPEAPTINEKAELIMHSPSLGPFYLVGEFLKSARQSPLTFKNKPDQGIVDISFGNCSPMSKIRFSVSSNFMTHLSNYISNREDNAPGLCCRFSDIETVMYLNRKRRRLDKPTLCHVFPHQIGMVQESEGNAYNSKYTKPRISDIKMLEPEESIQKDTQACLRFCETNMNITDEVHNLTLQQSLTCESSSNLQLGLHPHTCKVGPGAAKVKYIFGFNSSDFRKRLQKSCFGDITPLKSQLSAREKLTSGDFLVKRKDSYPDYAPCSVFNSKAGHQSKTNVPFCSTSLHMKFPKNFNLPTKELLIRKFSIFGSVDYLKTRVSYYTGSAQVAFFQQGDAVAAYRYAKKKVLFSDANVRFWLDPFDHKRIGFERFSLMPPSSSKPTGPPLKSCLKKSNSLRQENKKKNQRVRFTIET